MIPNERDEKVKWIQRNLLPKLDSQLSEAPEDEIDQEKIDRSKEILAEEYLDEGSSVLNTFIKVTLPLLVIDSFSLMPPQVYGLVFSITGTLIMLVEAEILGSTSITARSMDIEGGLYGGSKKYLDEGKARRLAHNTVITNIGLIWLLIGFLLQIVAVWAIPSNTLIQPLW